MDVGDVMLPRAGELFSWFESLLGSSAMTERSIVREFEREVGEVGRLEREKLVFKGGGGGG
jgi:hypothetical protein